MTVVKLIQDPSRADAENSLNAILEEYEKKGYESQVLNITATTPQPAVVWRFVVLFTETPRPWGPPVES